MNTSRGEVELPLSKASVSVHRSRRRLAVIGVMLTLLIILFLTMQWPQRDSNAQRVMSSDNNSSAENRVAFDYFSAQFGSLATNNATAERVNTY